MLETLWIVTSISLALMAILLLFPGSRAFVKRWGRALVYGTALIAILSWAILKSAFVLLGRRLLRH